MTDYVKTVDFAAKDALASGNPSKLVLGTEIDTEFDNIATAVATKANSSSPTLTTPNIGTPSAGTLTNCTGLPIVAGTTGTLSVARGGTGVTTSTGTGNAVLSTSPTLVTPNLGTPSAGVLTNCTGTASGLTAGAASSAANGNLSFPATQNPSADPNTLDDYEEGTWTPSLGGTTTYVTRAGKYTKIGNTVFYAFDIEISTIGTGSIYNIDGLPFSANLAVGYPQGCNIHYHAGIAVATYGIQGWIRSATRIDLFTYDLARTNSTQSVIFQNGTRINGSGFYTV